MRAPATAGAWLLAALLASLLGAGEPAPTTPRGRGAWGPEGGGGAEVREAYVTLAATPQYVIGAEVLAKCLRRTGTSRRMVAMIGSRITDIMEQRLRAAGWEIFRFDEEGIAPEAPDPPDRPMFNATYYKLHVFALGSSFDTVVFLDADTLVLENIDELFARDLSHGYPFAAAPEIMPPDRFNTGVMVVRPSAAVHADLVGAASRTQSMDGSVSEYMNDRFPDWYQQSSHHRLPFEYNVLQTIAHYYTPAWDLLRPAMKVLHFAGDGTSKPWSFHGSLPPSLGVYVYLWQSITRAGADEDISPLFGVLGITDADEVNALFSQ